MKLESIVMNGVTIRRVEQNGMEMLCLTDMMKGFPEHKYIENWIRNQSTQSFIASWEVAMNKNFNYPDLINEKSQMSLGEWIKVTDSKSLYVEKGRYGGSYATKEVTANFLMFLNDNYKVEIIRRALLGSDSFKLLFDFYTIATPTKKIKNCSVYLMKNQRNGHHKIGLSDNPCYREKTLQSQEPEVDLVICKEYESLEIAYKIEKELHNKYDDLRLRGEWFDLSIEMVIEIINFLK